MNFTDIKTAEEYKNLVSKYYYLVDSELKKIEKVIEEHSGQLEIESLPKLISLVNVIGYLRGQDNAFIDVRPAGVSEYQRELYDNEDAFEKRLRAIIDVISSNKEYLQRYKDVLERYFVKARVPH